MPTKFFWSRDDLENTPSRRDGISASKEQDFRQECSDIIEKVGARIGFSVLCVNTAIIYLQRFYQTHSHAMFHRFSVCAASLYLSSKINYEFKIKSILLNALNLAINDNKPVDMDASTRQSQIDHMIFDEILLMQTFGFDLTVDLPHFYVVKICTFVNATLDIKRWSYYLATTSLSLTNMCLHYTPQVMACFCIYLASKWTKWEISLTRERRKWFTYFDSDVTEHLLEQMVEEFTAIYATYPHRITVKSKDTSNTPCADSSAAWENIDNEGLPRTLNSQISPTESNHNYFGNRQPHQTGGKLETRRGSNAQNYVQRAPTPTGRNLESQNCPNKSNRSSFSTRPTQQHGNSNSNSDQFVPSPIDSTLHNRSDRNTLNFVPAQGQSARTTAFNVPYKNSGYRNRIISHSNSSSENLSPINSAMSQPSNLIGKQSYMNTNQCNSKMLPDSARPSTSFDQANCNDEHFIPSVTDRALHNRSNRNFTPAQGQSAKFTAVNVPLNHSGNRNTFTSHPASTSKNPLSPNPTKPQPSNPIMKNQCNLPKMPVHAAHPSTSFNNTSIGRPVRRAALHEQDNNTNSPNVPSNSSCYRNTSSHFNLTGEKDKQHKSSVTQPSSLIGNQSYQNQLPKSPCDSINPSNRVNKQHNSVSINISGVCKSNNTKEPIPTSPSSAVAKCKVRMVLADKTNSSYLYVDCFDFDKTSTPEVQVESSNDRSSPNIEFGESSGTNNQSVNQHITNSFNNQPLNNIPDVSQLTIETKPTTESSEHILQDQDLMSDSPLQQYLSAAENESFRLSKSTEKRRKRHKRRGSNRCEVNYQRRLERQAERRVKRNYQNQENLADEDQSLVPPNFNLYDKMEDL